MQLSEGSRAEEHRPQCYSNACLHATGIMLGLGHPDVKSRLLICSCNCRIGLLVGVVNSQLVKGNLRK